MELIYECLLWVTFRLKSLCVDASNSFSLELWPLSLSLLDSRSSRFWYFLKADTYLKICLSETGERTFGDFEFTFRPKRLRRYFKLYCTSFCWTRLCFFSMNFLNVISEIVFSLTKFCFLISCRRLLGEELSILSFFDGVKLNCSLHADQNVLLRSSFFAYPGLTVRTYGNTCTLASPIVFFFNEFAY